MALERFNSPFLAPTNSHIDCLGMASPCPNAVPGVSIVGIGVAGKQTCQSTAI